MIYACSYSHRSYIGIDPLTCGACPPSLLAKNSAPSRDTHWYSDVLNKRFKIPFRDGIWNRRQVSVGDRGVLPTRPRNRRG